MFSPSPLLTARQKVRPEIPAFLTGDPGRLRLVPGASFAAISPELARLFPRTSGQPALAIEAGPGGRQEGP